jgi:hypothetical protein
VKISVNGATVEVSEPSISYERLRHIAFCGKDDRTPSITFKGAAAARTEGTLAPGESVELAEGTAFNVYDTGNA